MIPLRHQIDEVRRELSLRQRAHPSFIAKGKMRQGEADLHMQRMQAVLETPVRLAAEGAGADHG